MTNAIKTIAFAAAAALTLGVSAPAFANSQLIAAAGLTPAQAQGLSVEEISRHVFNRGLSRNDQQAVRVNRVTTNSDRGQLIASAGLTNAQADGLSLAQIVAAKYNRDESVSDHQSIVKNSGLTVASRSFKSDNAAHRQLIASAGLTPAQAEGLTFNQIAKHVFNRGLSRTERQSVR